MKKVGICAIICMLILSLFLSSCDAFVAVRDFFSSDIMDKVARAMNRANSYEMVGETNFQVYNSKGPLAEYQSFSRQIVIQGKNDERYYYSFESIGDFNYGNVDYYLVEGFENGYYFFASDEFTLDLQPKESYCSKMTAKEFDKYYEKTYSQRDSFDGYSNLEHTENADGTHTIVLSGYDAQTLYGVNSSFGLPFHDEGERIVDIVVTITTDEKYRISEAKSTYVFPDGISSGEKIQTYSAYGMAQKQEGAFLFKDFTLIEDARIFSMFFRQLSEKVNMQNGQFTTSVHSVLTTEGAEDRAFYESTNVSFGERENGYYFDMHSSGDATHTRTSYENGVFMRDGREFYPTSTQNPSNPHQIAKNLLSTQIDPYRFRPYSIRNIMPVRVEGEVSYYEFYMTYSQVSDLNQIAERFSPRYEATEPQMYVCFEVVDGEIRAVEYRIESRVYDRGYFAPHEPKKMLTVTKRAEI